MVSAQTNIAANVTKQPVKEGGTHVRRSTAGLLEIICTASQKSFCLNFTKNSKENVLSAVKNQKRLEDCTLTIATKPEQFGVCYATAAMLELGHYAKAQKFLTKPLNI
jgi:hypothetical protein